ncbi:hypothetical protein J6590_021166 [Homalodisca vitripennis]|nr:hypothetical protein J6590_021166 [Homalodisca vitripennis]
MRELVLNAPPYFQYVIFPFYSTPSLSKNEPVPGPQAVSGSHARTLARAHARLSAHLHFYSPTSLLYPNAKDILLWGKTKNSSTTQKQTFPRAGGQEAGNISPGQKREKLGSYVSIVRRLAPFKYIPVANKRLLNGRIHGLYPPDHYPNQKVTASLYRSHGNHRHANVWVMAVRLHREGRPARSSHCAPNEAPILGYRSDINILITGSAARSGSGNWAKNRTNGHRSVKQRERNLSNCMSCDTPRYAPHHSLLRLPSCYYYRYVIVCCAGGHGTLVRPPRLRLWRLGECWGRKKYLALNQKKSK